MVSHSLKAIGNREFAEIIVEPLETIHLGQDAKLLAAAEMGALLTLATFSLTDDPDRVSPSGVASTARDALEQLGVDQVTAQRIGAGMSQYLQRKSKSAEPPAFGRSA